MKRSVKRGRVADEDEDALARTALPVGTLSAASSSSLTSALDGLSYLALVRAERENPRFVVTIAPEAKTVVETDAWTLAFATTFGKVHEKFVRTDDANALAAQLTVLRQRLAPKKGCFLFFIFLLIFILIRFRGLTNEVCQDLYCFAACLPSPLPGSSMADFAFFRKKLETEDLVENDAAHVAFTAIRARMDHDLGK